MSLLGKQIKLKGVSQKGKSRIREQGEDWSVLAETDRVLFSPDKVGPWLFVVPAGKTHDDKASRWVRSFDDADFQVVVQVA